jgi:hypothetical protein
MSGFVFAVWLLMWVLGGSHVADAGEVEQFFRAVAEALQTAVITGLVYLSLEPYVRRYWPQTIISWSRVLTGTIRDPIVARDVLMGVAGGVGLALLIRLDVVLLSATGGVGIDLMPCSLFSLSGGSLPLAVLCYSLLDSLTKALGTFFLIFLFRRLTGSRHVAAVFTVLVLGLAYGLGSNHPAIRVPIMIAYFIVAVTGLVRSGLLTLAVGMFTNFLLESYPVTLDFTSWKGPASWFPILVVIAMAVVAAKVALEKEPAWKNAG